MAKAALEHVNITVSDPDRTAGWLSDVFGWRVRWSGSAINGGRSVHVGGEDQYLAIYSGPGLSKKGLGENSYTQRGGLNHIGVVVDDLDAVETKVRALGFETFSHADYEPGRRYYFRDHDGIEFEVVSYA